MSRAAAPQTLRVGDVICEPGELAKGGILLAWLEDASAVHAPLLVMNGTTAGPTLLITAAMHGNEIVGAEVIRRLLRERLDPTRLRGAVVACPILHPIGFRMHQALTPRDGLNLIGAFPGDAAGSTTQQMADAIREGLLLKADHVIDIHSNPWPSLEWTMTAASTSEIGAASHRMATAVGLPLIEISESGVGFAALGSMLTTCMELGRPAILVELTGNRRFEDRPVEIGVRGMLNVLRMLGMVEGDIESQTDAVRLPSALSSFRQLRARRGGFAHRTTEPGEFVRRGDTLARIYDPYGDIVEETRSPIDGYVLSYGCWVNQTVQTGGFIVTVGSTEDLVGSA